MGCPDQELGVVAGELERGNFLRVTLDGVLSFAGDKVPYLDDAVGTGEAAEALRVEPSVVVVYAERGWIVGRKPVDRGRAASDSKSRWWILSQQSIDERRQRVIDAELTGSKPGVRKFFEDVG